MSVNYKYSISGNVTAQSVDPFNLHNDITDNLVLSNATFRGVNIIGDDLYVGFTESIEVSEKSNLNTIVQDHDNTPIPDKTNPFYFSPSKHSVSTTNYETIGCFLYPEDKIKTIRVVDVLSYMDVGASSYDVLIVNRKNNTTICESNFSNTSMNSNEITTINIDNVPTSLQTIEVMAKINKNGNTPKAVHIDQIVFWIS